MDDVWIADKGLQSLQTQLREEWEQNVFYYQDAKWVGV